MTCLELNYEFEKFLIHDLTNLPFNKMELYVEDD